MNKNDKPKLLIVDDERDNIRILFGTLHHDYDIIVADSGVLGLEKATSEKPDIILLDIVMPDIDGYDVLAQLKQKEETANIPVIFITGLITPQEESRGLALGAVDYITKPFNMNVVRTRLKKQLEIAGTIHLEEMARQNAESQMKKAYALVNSSSQYIAYVTANGKYEFMNPAICEITGYSYDELIAGGFYMHHDEKIKQRITNEIIPIINLHGKYDFELPLICKNGDIRIMSFSAFKVYLETDKYGIIATDITEQKYLHDEVIKMRDLAELANNAKAEFLSRMSHELRTPLNAIRGMTALAKTSKDLDKIAENLSKVESASEHLTILVNEILDMATINEGKLELIQGPINIRKLVDKIVAIISLRSDSKHQTLAINIDNDVPAVVIGDERRLSQILTNLLSNANKFTSEYGQIDLHLSNISVKEDCCMLKFQVKDNGIGISPENQERIFTAFEQVEGGLTRTYGGAGLGLALSRQFAVLMGGDLWVESSLGCGSTFFFTIKAGLEKVGGTTANENEDSKNLYKQVFLIAEDVEINREIIAALLEETGAVLDFAEDGQIAVDLFKANPNRYSLILMDINMPNKDGYQAAVEIRSLDSDVARNIPIIALTANTYKGDIKRCLAAGMNDHIGKPIDFNTLFEKIHKYL